MDFKGLVLKLVITRVGGKNERIEERDVENCGMSENANVKKKKKIMTPTVLVEIT